MDMLAVRGRNRHLLRLTQGFIGDSFVETREVEGSPPIRDRLATLAAGVMAVIDLRTIATAAPYMPFDSLVVTNNSDVQITLRVGARNDAYRILAREERKIEDRPFEYFTITNDDGATATGANTIEYVAERKPADADSEARRRLRR